MTIILLILLFLTPSHVESNPMSCTVPVGVKSAMQKMGPMYDYRIIPDGDLQVEIGDGEWLRLKYQRNIK